MILSRKSILFCCGLLILVRVALGAAGEYQQTRDGKTQVWNADPKPGDSASWQGSRDKERYATGFGTITWYNANGTVSAVYYGNMVNGKLEGPVNAHAGYSGVIWFSSSRWTAHAYFVDGSQATAWARGPAPSNMDVPEALVAKRLKAKTDARLAKTETSTEAMSADELEESATPSKPVTKKAELAPGAVRAIEKPGRTEKKIEKSKETTRKPKTVPKLEEPKTETAETPETPREVASEPPQVPTPEPSVEKKPEIVEQPPAEEPPKKTPSEDGSLNALVGPPSSLRSSSLRQASSPAKTRSTSAAVRGKAELSENEAIRLADTEARSRGYDLSEYQRPKTDYSAVKDKWSLFYSLKDPKMVGGELQPFSVTVEDKTKKAEVRKNY